MAYKQLKTTVAQTAANAAASIVAAKVEADPGIDIITHFDDVFDAIFGKLSPIVDEDNALLDAEREADESAPKAEKPKRERKTGNGGRSNGSAKFRGTLKDANKLALKYGAFEGVTLAELVSMSAEEADSDYDYGDGEKTGADYLAWAGSELNTNEYLREAAALVAEDAGIEVLQPR